MKAYARGAVDFLTKPVDVDVLRAKVSVFVELWRLRQREARRAAEKEARRAAETERANLRRLLAQAPAAFAIVRGPEHVYELSNALHQRLAGGRRLLGRPAREAIPELVAQGFVELLDRVYQGGEPHVATEVPARLHAPEGGEREAFLAASYQPLRGPDGSVEGVMCFAYEVTEQVLARQQAEELAEQLRREKERLAASEARYREMLETAQEGVWRLDELGVTTYVNRRLAEMLGHAVGDMLGRSLHEFVDAPSISCSSSPPSTPYAPRPRPRASPSRSPRPPTKRPATATRAGYSR